MATLATLTLLAALAATPAPDHPPAPAAAPATAAPAVPASPAAPASPAPVATPVPIIVPPAGIYRPNWETLDPKNPLPEPPPSAAPEGLPHYVGLGQTERALAERLRDLIMLLEGQLAARRLASARVNIDRAERHVAAAEAEHLVLRLHADWQAPRVRLLDLKARYETLRAQGIDPESQAVSDAAAKRVGARLAELEKGFPKLPAREAEKRLEAARRAVAEAEGDPLLLGNPAWAKARLALIGRLTKLEGVVAVRVGQAQLLEAVIRMADLKRSADARLAEGDWDGALGDLAALEEACLAFEHDLGELKGHGYDPKALAWFGPEGELRGAAFLARVAAWRAEAQRRWDVVERARARDRIRREGLDDPLLPPAVPAPPALPPSAPPTKGFR